MKSKYSLICLLSGAGVIVVAAAPHYHVMRPCTSCGIPDRDYQFASYSQPLIALSEVGVPIRPKIVEDTAPRSAFGPFRLYPGEKSPPTAPWEPVATNVRQVAGNLYHFVQQPVLTSGHCQVSEVAVQLYEDGRWTISLRADQNPLAPLQVIPNLSSAEPTTEWTDHLKRNQFRIKVRCYSNRGAGFDAVGKPVVAKICPPDFWVQQAQPLHYRHAGDNLDVAKFYDSIDRVEVEFSYRLAQYQATSVLQRGR